jgi:Protein of unknown function (DUF3309)
MRLQEISRWPGDRRGAADVIFTYSVLFKAEAPLFVEKKALSRVQRPPYSLAMRNILLIILVLILIGAFPGWGYSSGWGYYPFGGIGLVLLIVLILALTGRL